MKQVSCSRLAAWLSVLMLPFCSAAQAPQPVVEDVPFITTPDHVTVAMLELAGVGPRDHVIDLGSGDGRIVITAAKRFGASGLGVEIVPDLVAQSRDNARRAGVSARTRFEVQDLFTTELGTATVVTMYLLPEVNLALRPRLLALAPGTRIVSHDWDMGDWAPDRTLTVAVPDKALGKDKFSRLHLWQVPARVEGLWCGAGGVSLQLTQRFQQLQATLTQGGESHGLSGRADGRWLRLLGDGGREWAARETGGLLQMTAAGGAAGGAPAGAPLRRATGPRCD